MNKKILIAGGTGFIGMPLADHLVRQGYDVVILSRKARNSPNTKLSTNIEFAMWDAKTGDGWCEKYDGAHVIINLAGQNIASGLWTKRRKKRILQSRIDAGTAIVDGVNRMKAKPELIIQASGVGYYGLEDHKKFNEDSPNGFGFLASVAKAWESAILPLESQTNVAILRFGVVLHRDALLIKMATLQFRMYLGGHLGSGKQWMSWIYRDELLDIITFIIRNKAKGVYNVCSPRPVTGKEFFAAFAQAIQRPSWFPVPYFILRTLAGELANEMILNGQRVIPKRLLEVGYRFQYEDIQTVMRQILKS
ncbi:TIGR01777 family oxidoreductase [candidate division KSB1 bacterium]|nr:TIGR01777 family oxidoreductase [candidate division KSB1 bacterium]